MTDPADAAHQIHPTPLQLSMYADDSTLDMSIENTSTGGARVRENSAGGTGNSSAQSVATHVQGCTACQAQLASIQAERRFLTSALQLDTAVEQREGPLPKFSKPISLRGFAMANLATGLVIWLVQFLWKTLFGELVMNATSWATSIYLPDIYEVASATALHLIEEGTAMLDAYLGFVVVISVTLTVLGLLLKHRRGNSATFAATGLLVVMAGTMAVPAPATALEIRRDENSVTIAKTETIDDTVFVASETIVIEGVIKGDLVAVGRRIDISGTVEGNLVTFAQTVTVRGTVGGFALGGASSYDLKGATVGGDLWAAGEKIGIDSEATVNRNVTVAGQSATVEGSIRKDLSAFVETVELSGSLGEDLEAYAAHVQLLGEAKVGGNLRIRSDGEDSLHRADTATVSGTVEFLGLPEEFQEENEYSNAGFYLWEIAGLIAAFAVGMALFWLVPTLSRLSIGSGSDTAKTAGIGLLTMLGVPIAALVVAITLVGIPLSAIAFGALVVGIYLAKIIIGAVIGRMVLGDSDSIWLPLLVGLIIVTIAVNVPFIGGILSFVFTVIGLGLLVQYLWDLFTYGPMDDELQPA